MTRKYYDYSYDRQKLRGHGDDYLNPTGVIYHTVLVTIDSESTVLKVHKYTAVHLLRDIGGLLSVLTTFCKILVPAFGRVQIYSFLAKDGYRPAHSLKHYGSFCWIMSYLCSCCDRDRAKKRQALEYVQRDISANLDLLTLLKRLRVHGQILEKLTSK